MNALAKQAVGNYLNKYFASSYQKVGTFTKAGDQKQGGNVASYFTTPGGHILHVIAGPVGEQTLLREARWVVETWKLAQLQGADKTVAKLKLFLRKVHAERLREEHNLDLRRVPLPNVASQQATPALLMERTLNWRPGLDNAGRVHLLLACYPLVRIEEVYGLVFERILNQPLSTVPVVQRG
ncbi:MAG TPA: hypothetical protein VEL76_31005 [Gemmataceae bacterium]|nr:hypothetical protein [Gemmataceae bacterium]